MLSFVVFQGESPGAGFPLRHAFLVGPDGIGLGVDVALRDDGLIVCQLPERASAGLSLQVPIDELAGAGGASVSRPLGTLSLRTCLLPPRERPYLLSLELARHRIMLFLNKLEDWALFELGPDDPIMLQFERARQTFTQALVAERSGPSNSTAGGHTKDADRLAWQALALAIDAGEQLAVRDASRDIGPRLSGQTYGDAVEAYVHASGERPPPNVPIIVQNSLGVTLPGRPVIGCEVSPARFSEALQRYVAASCDFVTLPMRWVDMEPSEGEYSFAGTDRWIEWAVRKARLPVYAGPVIDFRPADVPDWIYIWENDYETLRELVYEHVKAIVTRYRRTVSRWTVASGLHVNTNFRMSYEQIMDLTRLCVLLVKKLQPTAKVQVEIDQPWGEHYAVSRQSIPPTLYADTVSQAGIPADAYAVRLKMGIPERGCSARDLMELSSILDRYAALERPIMVTACAVPSEPAQAAADKADLEPGYWRERWSERVQAAWLANVAAIALAKPFVHGLCWAELADPPGAPASTGLVSAAGTPKPALERLAGIRTALAEARPWPTA
ncbi:MAG TPA: endo-1,4-beta-xylanase [Phycisphaerales bacterium]|nr:endo-1,4-beta-xylanase [Phycisphaerales bacterium]